MCFVYFVVQLNSPTPMEILLNNDDITRLAAMDPADWPWDDVKRHVRSNKRCLLEVY